MIQVHIVFAVAALVVAAALGAVYGRLAMRWSLLSGGADPDDRCPVCLDGKYWYMVPENEYVNVVLPAVRRAARRPDQT